MYQKEILFELTSKESDRKLNNMLKVKIKALKTLVLIKLL